MKEQQARERTREQRLVISLLERQLNPKDGNTSGQTVTFSTLQSWRQWGRISTESTKDEDTQEKSQEFRENSRFTGIVIGSEKEKKENDKKLLRVESDNILLIVPVQINGKMFSSLNRQRGYAMFCHTEMLYYRRVILCALRYFLGIGKWHDGSFPQ